MNSKIMKCVFYFYTSYVYKTNESEGGVLDRSTS